jgi:hypothetical protein
MQLAIDRENDQGAAFLQEISKSIAAKAARVDESLVADVASTDVVPGTADNEPTPGPAPARK